MTKSIKKKIPSLVLICISLIMIFSTSTSTVRVDASELVTPRYNNVFSAQSYAKVSTSGKLTVTNTYEGRANYLTKAVITTYVEKKVSSSSWSRIDIGMTNDEWRDTVYDYAYAGSHSVQLPSKGTYRISVKYVISGTGGSADVITDKITIEY